MIPVLRNMIFLNMTRLRKGVSFLCLAAFIVTSLVGCGKNVHKEEVPELVETTVTNESYRTVVRGNVGDVKIIPARAVPRSYGQFFEKGQNISEIYVDIGDCVSKGDRIASADTTEVDDRLKTLKSQREALLTERDGYEENSELKTAYIEYERMACEEVGDTAGADAKSKEKELEREDSSYRLERFDRELDSLDQDIKAAEDERSRLILYATHSGYVTYKMNMEESNGRGAYENVVMLSDYDDVYLEAETVALNKFGKYRTADRMMAVVNGKRYDAFEDVYSTAAISYAASVEKYPRVRFSVPGADIKLGDVVPVLIYMDFREDVIMVGNDSIRNDGSDRYVFVLTDGGGMEKRIVETGSSDSRHTEIISGLEEGEKVYYLSDSLKPAKYKELTVESSDYTYFAYSESMEFVSTDVDVYSIPMNGTFRDYDVSANTYVESGEKLFSVEVSTSEAGLLEQKQEIEKLKKQHETAVKEGNEKLNELSKMIDELPGEAVPAATDTDAVLSSLYRKEKLQIEKQMLLNEMDAEEESYEERLSLLSERYDEDCSIMDSDGIISVYSKRPGTVRFPADSSGYRNVSLSEGIAMLSIECGDADKLLVEMVRALTSMEDDNYTKRRPAPRPGTKLYLAEGGDEPVGECMANIGDAPEDKLYYLEEWDGHIYITSCPGNAYHNTSTGYFAHIYDESESEAGAEQSGKTDDSAGAEQSGKTDDSAGAEQNGETDDIAGAEQSGKTDDSAGAEQSGITEDGAGVEQSGKTEDGAGAESQDESDTPANKHAAFKVMDIKDAIVIPSECVFSQKGSGSSDVYFVWLIEDGELVKRYVEYVADYSVGGDALILDGLYPGDRIALEIKGVQN